MSTRKTIKGHALDAKRADKKLRASLSAATFDSFNNFAAKLGIGTDNLSSFATYGFNPVTRNRILLEWIHRGSWIGGMAVDIFAKDMTRAGVTINGELKPDKIQQIETAATHLGIWNSVFQVVQWSRLYGGALGVLLIDGQNMQTPLRLETVGKGQFRGLYVLDRWQVEPQLNQLVTELGPNLGKPKFYRVTMAPVLMGQLIHHSRVIRLTGVDLPYNQAIQEMLWGLSVYERMYDRMTAFDSATTGAAQLVYKAFIRTYKVKGLREVVATGGAALEGLVKYVDMMRRFQSIEGVTLLDGEDEFDAHSHTAFGGLSDALIQFGQQLAGATGIPLVRLFGQSPAGLNSTGESDLRNYYDGINQQQVAQLKVPMTAVYRALAQSEGIKIGSDFGITFNPLWQLTPEQKADVATKTTEAVTKGQEAGLVSQQTAMKELKQSSVITGVWSNITDEEIKAAEEDLPPGPAELADQQQELAEQQAAEGGDEPGTPGAKGKKKPPTKDLASRTRDAQPEGEYGTPNLRYTPPPKPGEKFHCGSCIHFHEQPLESGNDRGTCDHPKAMLDAKGGYLVFFDGKPLVHIDGCSGYWWPRGKAMDSAPALFTFHHGLQLVIENPAGSQRSGRGWAVTMPVDYGYIRGVMGADGDGLDCFVGPNPESNRVFVVNQGRKLRPAQFDEHKVMLGFANEKDALDTFRAAYDSDPSEQIQSVVEMSMDNFKQWISSGVVEAPAK